jgi:hypothetical protein
VDDWAVRLARFQREAHILAALDHPNIAQSHGFEKSPVANAHPYVPDENIRRVPSGDSSM